MGPREWTAESWRDHPVTQGVEYPVGAAAKAGDAVPDAALWRRKKGLAEVKTKLKSLPPLVSAVEIERLKLQLAAVAKGDAFLLQGGPCAEVFDYCVAEKIEHEISLLLSMSLILIWGMKLPVVRIARMGGQYAKPRSKPTEIVDGREINSFRGDNVNGYDVDDRTPDPERLVGAYFHSAATINHLRSLLASGFASLPTHSSESVPWSLPLSHVRSPALQKAYVEIVRNLSEALEFMRVIGADGNGSEKSALSGGLKSAEVWMSHEALLLEYEEALTRKLKIPAFARGEDDEEMGFYCTSAHFIWIGDRTRSITGAHVEFFRGLRNPIGIKVGPSMGSDELVRLLDILDPRKEAGRVTLICRYGADKVQALLPGHIKAVQASGHPVVWSQDPMHGNGKVTSTDLGSVKTRAMHDIITEISLAMTIHQAQGSRLGGVHLELTGDIDEEGFSVTECIGGSMELGEESLKLRYDTYCDPRLNFEQSLDVAFMISNQARGRPGSDGILAELQRNQSLERAL